MLLDITPGKYLDIEIQFSLLPKMPMQKVVIISQKT